ncbi:hypothetical protein MBAV_006296 [Candidatus Magnetobacterium bavaricum]|uniref:Uncharacterized protein n=1 Tax=Candidatus Magnetobacterium bavaricum TaxID=29290 RepID=A0A0F3GHZ5_9BACT|nr:hypothetical protein MBAV_006296 [Candidatus Magnetobacterium bavaricum]
MTLVEFLHSPLFVTLSGLAGGGFLSNYVVYKWQQRKALYDLKLNAYKNTTEIYHSLLKYLHRIDPDDEDAWRDTHGSFKAANKLNKVLFKDEEIFNGWEFVAQNIANLRDLKKKDAKDRSIQPLKDKVFDKSAEAIESMARELKI